MRRLLQFGVVLVFAGVLVSGAPAHRLIVSMSAPTRVIEGQQATVHTSAYPSKGSCVLTITYTGGRVWRKTQTASNHVWAFRVPVAVPPGAARLRLKCGAAGTASATMQVLLALQPSTISVGKQGFSQRNHSFDFGSDVDYAVAIHNDSALFDAKEVNVLVNFVAADNRVLGTDHRFLQRLPANTLYYVGAQARLPDQTQVARLEVVVSAKPAYQKPAQPPLVSDVEIRPNKESTPYVLAIQGEILNKSTLSFLSADIGIAIVDSAGNIVGGGSAHAQGPVKPDTREAFTSTGPYTAVPVSRAASVLFSVVPNYG